MKGLSTFVAIQALLSTISGVLMSQMSFIGKVGISVLYQEYGLFKIWWKTAILLFVVHLLLIALLWLTKKVLGRRISRPTILLFLVFGLAGAYFTYLDFTTTSHRLMKMNFHTGTYLFWGSWLLSCIYFLVTPISRKPQIAAAGTEEMFPPLETL